MEKLPDGVTGPGHGPPSGRGELFTENRVCCTSPRVCTRTCTTHTRTHTYIRHRNILLVALSKQECQAGFLFEVICVLLNKLNKTF